MAKTAEVQRARAFHRVIDDYERYRKPYPARIFRLLESVVPKTSCLRMLDVGCGTGKSTEPLVKKGRNVTGCDPDAVMLRSAEMKAKKHGLPISYLKGQAETLRFPRHAFDVVTAGSAFHWFANPVAVRNIHRLMVPGGLIFFYWMDRGDQSQTWFWSVFKRLGLGADIRAKSLSFRALRQLLTRAGFSRIQTGNFSYMVSFTEEELQGGARTSSAYAILDPQRRQLFEERYAAVLERRFKGKNRLMVKRTIRFCYGFVPELSPGTSP